MDVYVHDCRGGAILGPYSEEDGKKQAQLLNEFVAKNEFGFLGFTDVKGPFYVHPDGKRRYFKGDW